MRKVVSKSLSVGGAAAPSKSRATISVTARLDAKTLPGSQRIHGSRDDDERGDRDCRLNSDRFSTLRISDDAVLDAAVEMVVREETAFEFATWISAYICAQPAQACALCGMSYRYHAVAALLGEADHQLIELSLN